MGQGYQERMTRPLLVLALVLGGCGVEVEHLSMPADTAANALHAGADIGYRSCKMGLTEEAMHTMINRSVYAQ